MPEAAHTQRDDGRERRNAERFVASLSVNYRTDGTKRVKATRSWDIGERGVCVKGKRPILIGAQVDLEIELIMPTPLRLGYDIDALVIDGPPKSYFARVPGTVRRCDPCPDGATFDVGIEFCEACDAEQLRIIDMYLDHLREGFRHNWV